MSFHAVQEDVRKNLANSAERTGLFQLYDKLQAIKDGRLPPALSARYDGVQHFFPVILLYDQIQFANADSVLGNLLQSELRGSGISNFSYQIWHIEELEDLLHLVPNNELVGWFARNSAIRQSARGT